MQSKTTSPRGGRKKMGLPVIEVRCFSTHFDAFLFCMHDG